MDYLIFKEKSIENLKVAEMCFEKGKYNACVNRAYYAMFHIIIAILLKDGKQFAHHISHDKVIGSFVQRYCNEAKTFPLFRRYLKDIQLERNIADYENRHITKKRANRTLKKATQFIETILESQLGG